MGSAIQASTYKVSAAVNKTQVTSPAEKSKSFDTLTF